MPLESYSQQHHSKTNQSVYTNRTKYIRLTATFHLTLMMTSAQVVERAGGLIIQCEKCILVIW